MARITLQKTDRAGGKILIDNRDYGHRWEIQGSTIVAIYASGGTESFSTEGELKKSFLPRRTDNLPLTFDW